jgi:hypothetical protein
MVDMDEQEAEDHIIAHQGGLIRKQYGVAQGVNCNYGWAIDSRVDTITVSTKLYGLNLILVTEWWWKDGVYLDRWEPYR